jgi:type II secretory pathway pseudopilin PulG
MRLSGLRGEAGMAMPVVIAIMTIVTMLAAGGAVAAMGTNESANEDRRAKRALAAAEAALQQAAYRLSTVRPDATLCLSDDNPAAGELPQSGECPKVTGTLAADTSFSYHATPALPSEAACADLPDRPPDPTSTDHCITATGSVGGVKRRLQARVRVARGGIFSVVGLLGIDGVNINNSGKVYSDIGSNGLIYGGNSTELTGNVLIPNSAPAPMINGKKSGHSVIRRPDPWQLEETDFTVAAAQNNNAALSGWTTSWSASTKVAALSDKDYTLPAGTYHMCELYIDQSTDIELTGASAANPVRIYVDSPSRAGSGCAAGTGRLCMDNSVKFNRPGDAAALQIYVHGTTAVCQTGRPGMPFQASSYRTDVPVVLNNSVDFNGTIYAPTTAVRLNNSVNMDGGIVAKHITLENSINFTHPTSLKGQQAAPGPVRRVSWVECRSEPATATDPESGCT